MKKLKEANDSWGAMLPVRNNRVVPVDLTFLKSATEEELFGVYDIDNDGSFKVLTSVIGDPSGFITATHLSPTVNGVKLKLNRFGYDIDIDPLKREALDDPSFEGFVDFPIISKVIEKVRSTLLLRVHMNYTTDLDGTTTRFAHLQMIPID